MNDKQLPIDVNDGNHLVLYRRRLDGEASDESSFVSQPLRSSILCSEEWKKKPFTSSFPLATCIYANIAPVKK